MKNYIFNQFITVKEQYIKDKYICVNCVPDKHIKIFLNTKLEYKNCTYCNQKSSVYISANLKDVLEFIFNSISTEWVVNTEEFEIQAREYGWYGGERGVVNLERIIKNELPKLEINNKQLFIDILSILPNEWRPKQQYEPDPDDFVEYRWDKFADAVKYQTRYTYYRKNVGWIKDVENRQRDSKFKPRDSHILEEFIDRIEDLNLINSFQPGQKIWRARKHNFFKNIKTPTELGPPPIDKSISTRMSPIGIPVFYGSLERDTAIAEILNGDDSINDLSIVSIGKWETLNPLRILNLANIPIIPSLFDPNNRILRYVISFLRSFCEEITRPIQKSSFGDIDYIPTQVFTEYIKFYFQDKQEQGVDGILYNSSIKTEGNNCVLFFDNDKCIDFFEHSTNKVPNSNQKLKLVSRERVWSTFRIKIA
jgi:hypothetical protein